jgi:hypothetical protein
MVNVIALLGHLRQYCFISEKRETSFYFVRTWNWHYLPFCGVPMLIEIYLFRLYIYMNWIFNINIYHEPQHNLITKASMTLEIVNIN